MKKILIIIVLLQVFLASCGVLPSDKDTEQDAVITESVSVEEGEEKQEEIKKERLKNHENICIRCRNKGHRIIHSFSRK